MKNIFLFLRWLRMDNYLPVRYIWYQVFHNLNSFFFQAGVTLYNWKHREAIAKFKNYPKTKDEQIAHYQFILSWYEPLPSTDAYYLESFKIRATSLLNQTFLRTLQETQV